MALIQGWMPPTRENYELILTIWKWSYPIIGSIQWLTSWYGMGKTSVDSALNIPGRVAWLTMECPGFMTLLYIVATLPATRGIGDLPWQNLVLAGLFCFHYAYRAVIFPFIQPSMSPIHAGPWIVAIGFQLLNATCLGSWLAAYGPVTAEDWAATSSLPQFALGVAVFYAGLAGNFFHDEELRDIRRRAMKRQETARREQKQQEASSDRDKGGATVHKHYEVPEAGLFRYMLFPHYFCEWLEWAGFWIAAGLGSVPARTFLVNELFVMVPRAVRGKAWYQDRFGKEKIGQRWAAIPGIW